MNRQSHSDESLESDPVWKLLDETSPVAPRGSFADDVVRMAKLEAVSEPWWKSWRLLAPSVGVAATAAVIIAFAFLANPGSDPSEASITDKAVVIPPDNFADLQDFAETETLIAAADHLDDFSDQELAGLIGF
jgi:hypothetical protein